MANTNYVRQVRQYDPVNGDRVSSTEVQERSTTGVALDDTYASSSTVAQRIVSYIVGIVEVLLVARFLLALFGANPSNGLVNLVYSLTRPLIAPFIGIFGNPVLGVSHFETATIVAMIVYALIGWGINAAINLGRKGAGEVDL